MKMIDLIIGQYEWIAAVFCGGILDLIFADPYGLPHPVRLIGRLIQTLETGLRKMFPKTKTGERAAGRELVIFVLMISGGTVYLILRLTSYLPSWCSFAVSSIICYQMLAAKGLYLESMKVYEALNRRDLEAARKAVSMIVGRDTERLDETGIIKAAVETVAENASDGVVAPMFYLLLFGPIGGVAYKAVNTMDSMVGYKNETYINLGYTAAKLDDILNWIPSRLTALLMIAAAGLLPGCSAKKAFRIWRRDKRNHKSPNSAQSESACAGALGVMLAGDAWYFGKLYKKPTIGDADRPVECRDIYRANVLMFTAAGIGFVVISALCMCCLRGMK